MMTIRMHVGTGELGRRRVARQRYVFLLLAFLAVSIASSPACVDHHRMVEGMIKRTCFEGVAWVVLDDDRSVIGHPSWAASTTTTQTVAARGAEGQSDSWADLKEEIGRLGRLVNPKGRLIILPATEHEKNLEMVVNECKKAGVDYSIWSPVGHVLDEALRPCRDERSAAPALTPMR